MIQASWATEKPVKSASLPNPVEQTITRLQFALKSSILGRRVTYKQKQSLWNSLTLAMG